MRTSTKILTALLAVAAVVFFVVKGHDVELPSAASEDPAVAETERAERPDLAHVGSEVRS